MSSYYIQQNCPICGAYMIRRDYLEKRARIECTEDCDLSIREGVARSRDFDLDPRPITQDYDKG